MWCASAGASSTKQVLWLPNADDMADAQARPVPRETSAAGGDDDSDGEAPLSLIGDRYSPLSMTACPGISGVPMKHRRIEGLFILVKDTLTH